MDTFDQDMEEDQPLDLSMKSRGVASSPISMPVRPEGKHHGQDSPLCLIKDCGCNNHGPKSRAIGGASIYDCGKYGPPVGDLPTGGQVMRFSGGESLESRSGDRDGFEDPRSCYEHADVPRVDVCRQNSMDRPWKARRHPSNEERMETSLERTRFEELNSSAQSRYKLPFRTCVSTESDIQTAGYRPTPNFYDNCDQNPQSFVDLNNSGSKRDSIWRPPVNNEERFRVIGGAWSEESAAPSKWGWSGRAWNRSDSYPSQSHWRPFVDNTDANTSGRSKPQDRETLKSARVESTTPQSVSKIELSGVVKTSPQNLGNKVQSGDSSQPPPRSVCHSFASTVPLITSSSSVPSRRETHSLPSTPRTSGSPLVVSRAPYTTIRVTRSPKTFHNESIRASLDSDARGCPFKRPQDGSRRFMSGKVGNQEKENIDLTDTAGSDAPSEGVKMPALDYLISKVLVERIDIPFKPCNTEIKKIYNGESKGRLRLVDLIELQVEESLKA